MWVNRSGAKPTVLEASQYSSASTLTPPPLQSWPFFQCLFTDLTFSGPELYQSMTECQDWGTANRGINRGINHCSPSTCVAGTALYSSHCLYVLGEQRERTAYFRSQQEVIGTIWRTFWVTYNCPTPVKSLVGLRLWDGVESDSDSTGRSLPRAHRMWDLEQAILECGTCNPYPQSGILVAEDNWR